ncbi:DUF4333 domain-containing protein [Geodermatophilus tzadiensis]|nr:DUF4333 domain-containing protein [Geodermatophilus tzadiensis]
MAEKPTEASSAMRRWRLILLGLVLLLGVAACAHPVEGVAAPAHQPSRASSVLDPDGAERDIAAQFEDTFGVASEISCTQRMHVITGAQYECTGRTDDGEGLTIRVVITDAVSASYTWEIV